MARDESQKQKNGFRARSRRRFGFCRMRCLELGPDNKLAYMPSPGQSASDTNKGAGAKSAISHFARTKEQGSRSVEDPEQVIAPNYKTWIHQRSHTRVTIVDSTSHIRS